MKLTPSWKITGQSDAPAAVQVTARTRSKDRKTITREGRIKARAIRRGQNAMVVLRDISIGDVVAALTHRMAPQARK
jgi:hypothetical protein